MSVSVIVSVIVIASVSVGVKVNVGLLQRLEGEECQQPVSWIIPHRLFRLNVFELFFPAQCLRTVRSFSMPSNH